MSAAPPVEPAHVQVFCYRCHYSSGCWLKPGQRCESNLATAPEKKP